MIVMRNGRREAMQEKFAECSDQKRSPQIISQLGDLRMKIWKKKCRKSLQMTGVNTISSNLYGVRIQEEPV